MKYFSTFSGIGGFEKGIRQAYENKRMDNFPRQVATTPRRQKEKHGAGVDDIHALGTSDGTHSVTAPTCIGYSEIDKYAVQIYEKHFNHKNYGDITKINPKDLPDFELFVGGFPCQAFSIAGKRGGFDDTRGTMFFEIARIVGEKQPRLLLLENVKGLLSHDKGRTFGTIIRTLDELGYDLQWQVLNSKNHGVPQNRERVFIVGHFRGTPRPEVFPFGESGEVNNGKNAQRDDVAHTVQNSDKHRGSYIKQINQPKHSNDRVYGTDGVSPTLNTMQGGRRQPFIRTENMNGDGFENEYSGTVRAGASRNYQLVNNIRRLTPLECERLQGFPDGWTEGVSDTQRYKTLGNAVTVNVVRDVMCGVL